MAERKKKAADGMKSAVELAMERYGRGKDDVREISDAQRRALREVEQDLQAKLAEIEIMAAQGIGEAKARGDFEEAEKLQSGKVAETSRLRRAAERKKEKIRGLPGGKED